YDLNCENMLPKILNIIERNWNLISESKERLQMYFNMLKSFDCNFYKNSTAATVYSVFEYELGKNLLLKNSVNNVLKGFDDEIEARGVLNIFNYWNFIWDLVTKVEAAKSEKDFPEIENC